MTVTYTAEVATCRGFGCFLKLLKRWRGSIYKLVWLDLLSFLVLYYVLNLSYRFILNPKQKIMFEAVVHYCNQYSDSIPLSFVLGFYVSIVMTRWWSQYTILPWPDSIAVYVSSNVHGQDERGRVMRRTVMRYVCLCLTMVLINIAPRVKKRFPKLENLVEAGLLNDNEREIIESLNKSFPRHSKHWLPIVWAASIVTRARKEGRIRDDFAVKTIIDELNKFRGQCGLLISYDTISVPLVYTQVVTLAVYSYFLTCVMGQQWTEGKQIVGAGTLNKIDLYFPVFSTLQFFFYMGWLKVAESLINPFGEDDDDFEVNWMVDRNLQVSYLIVDEMHHEHPQLIKDQYWDEVFPNELPYSIASERFREEHPEPSTAKIEVSKNAAMPSTLSSVRIDEMVCKEKVPLLQGQGTAQTTTQNQLQNQNQTQAVNYKTSENNHDEEADDASGIHFTAGNGKTRQGSSPSLVSLSGTISRVNTVASALKRLLSREDSRTGFDDQQKRIQGSASTTSLTGGNVTKLMGSMRLTDQVIEEVDEQATITSMGAGEPTRPNVLDIFAQSTSNNLPKRSVPMNIPLRPKSYGRTNSDEPNLFPPGGVDALLSTSAPVGGCETILGRDTTPNSPAAESAKSLLFKEDIGSRETERPDGPTPVFRWHLSAVEDMDRKSNVSTPAPVEVLDDFEKLKVEREKQRQDRQKQKFARSISNAPGGDMVATAAILLPTCPTVPNLEATNSGVSSTPDIPTATTNQTENNVPQTPTTMTQATS